MVALKNEEEAERWMGGADFKRDHILHPDGLLQVERGVPKPRTSSTPKIAKPKAKKEAKPKEPPAQRELWD